MKHKKYKSICDKSGHSFYSDDNLFSHFLNELSEGTIGENDLLKYLTPYKIQEIQWKKVKRFVLNIDGNIIETSRNFSLKFFKFRLSIIKFLEDHSTSLLAVVAGCADLVNKNEIFSWKPRLLSYSIIVPIKSNKLLINCVQDKNVEKKLKQPIITNELTDNKKKQFKMFQQDLLPSGITLRDVESLEKCASLGLPDLLLETTLDWLLFPPSFLSIGTGFSKPNSSIRKIKDLLQNNDDVEIHKEIFGLSDLSQDDLHLETNRLKLYLHEKVNSEFFSNKTTYPFFYINEWGALYGYDKILSTECLSIEGWFRNFLDNKPIRKFNNQRTYNTCSQDKQVCGLIEYTKKKKSQKKQLVKQYLVKFFDKLKESNNLDYYNNSDFVFSVPMTLESTDNFQSYLCPIVSFTILSPECNESSLIDLWSTKVSDKISMIIERKKEMKTKISKDNFIQVFLCFLGWSNNIKPTVRMSDSVQPPGTLDLLLHKIPSTIILNPMLNNPGQITVWSTELWMESMARY